MTNIQRYGDMSLSQCFLVAQILNYKAMVNEVNGIEPVNFFFLFPNSRTSHIIVIRMGKKIFDMKLWK